MPDYLSSKDWRSVLDAKEHKSVKKTGVSETLDDFASARKKGELGKMVSALQRIVEKADIELAFELKGKRGPFFIGRIYGEAGKFVLETEVPPVPGMAKAAENAALLHAEMNIKVLVRGGGVELDSDADMEPNEEGEGPMGPRPETNTGHVKTFEDRVNKLTDVVNRFALVPNRTVEGAADGFLGAIRVLLDQVANDSQMTGTMKEDFRLLITGLRMTVTGTSKRLPIEHGSSLPDPEALQANAQSLRYPLNIMACPDIEQTQQVMGPESLQSLLRLDPDAIVQDMKQARNDMARRHKDTEGTISDAAIEAMGAPVRFVQAAAPTVPVGLLFQMLAQGALRIAKAKPEGIPALIETLRAEVEEATPTKSEINEAVEGLMATGDRASNPSMILELGALGWGWNFTGQDWDHWISVNAKLVSRILKTRMVNPALQNEIDRLLPLAKANAPRIETTILSFEPPGKYTQLFDAANKDFEKGPSFDTPLETLREEFDRLGGLPALQSALRSFPNDIAPCLPEPAGEDEDEITEGWIRCIKVLRQWAALQAKGGVARLLELSPGLSREMPITTAIRTIDEKSLSGDAINDLMDLDEEEIEERTAAQYLGLQNDLKELVPPLREPGELGRITTLRDQAIALWTQGKATGVVTLLGKAKRMAEEQLPKERDYAEEIQTQKTTMRETLDKAEEGIATALTPHMERLLQMLDEGAKVCSQIVPSRVQREFKNRIEIAEKGEESAFARSKLPFRVSLTASMAMPAWSGKPSLAPNWMPCASG